MAALTLPSTRPSLAQRSSSALVKRLTGRRWNPRRSDRAAVRPVRRGAPGQGSPDGGRPDYRCHKVRATVEHVFACQKQRLRLVVRTVGLARVTTKLGLANRAYNLLGFVWLEGRAAFTLPCRAALRPASGPMGARRAQAVRHSDRCHRSKAIHSAARSSRSSTLTTRPRSSGGAAPGPKRKSEPASPAGYCWHHKRDAVPQNHGPAHRRHKRRFLAIRASECGRHACCAGPASVSSG